MGESLRESAAKWISFVLLAVVLVGGVILVLPTYRRNQALRRQSAELEQRMAERRQEIEALKVNQRRFNDDPDFVEQIARQSRRVYPGELVFVFESER